MIYKVVTLFQICSIICVSCSNTEPARYVNHTEPKLYKQPEKFGVYTIELSVEFTKAPNDFKRN